jgi:hypothetical protein
MSTIAYHQSHLGWKYCSQNIEMDRWWSLTKHCSDLTRKMQSVCRGVISARHIYRMYYATPSLYYVITDIYGSHVHSRLCTSCQVCCYIKWSEKHHTEVALGWTKFSALDFKILGLVQFQNRAPPIWNSSLPCALNVHCSDSFVFGKNYPNFN